MLKIRSDIPRSARKRLAAREVLVTLVQAAVRGHLQRARISDELQAHLRCAITSHLAPAVHNLAGVDKIVVPLSKPETSISTQQFDGVLTSTDVNIVPPRFFA